LFTPDILEAAKRRDFSARQTHRWLIFIFKVSGPNKHDKSFLNEIGSNPSRSFVLLIVS
jgi:hypothetical protein